MTDEDGREDVARAGEMHGNLGVRQLEILACEMVEAHHAVLAVDHYTCNYHRLGSRLAECVNHAARLGSRHPFRHIGRIRQITSLGVVGIDEMSHRDHLEHAADGGRSHAIVEFTLIAHDRVDEDDGAAGRLLLAIGRHDARLTLRDNESRGDGVEAETQFLPHGEDTRDIVGGIEDIELAVVERVGHQCRGQVIHRQAHI